MAQNNKPSRKQMLDWVDMVSFAVVESNLYLDTHPDDPEALAFFEENKTLREQALKDYAALYGPLTIDCATGMNGKWDWVLQPWPWEGGAC